MAKRVATLDMSTYLSHYVHDIVAIPYRDNPALSPFLKGGLYFLAIVQLPQGPHVDGFFAFEDVPGPAFQRLRTEDGDHFAEIWGWERPHPVPEDVTAGPRVLTIDMSQHVEPQSRIDHAHFCGRLSDGRPILEVEFETPRNVLNQPDHGVWDTLDEHPAELRAFIENFGQTRRADASTEAPPWEWNGNGLVRGNGHG